MTGRAEYRTWQGMIRRCTAREAPAYRYYGGRGIKVCKGWRKFAQFFKDMGFKPSRVHTLERINNEGNYCLSNCRWATRKEQGNNRRSNHHISLNGVRLTVQEWSERLGIKAVTIHNRLRKGLSKELALSTYIGRGGHYHKKLREREVV
jgi:hypothetical protein